jgi:hypothetical protein
LTDAALRERARAVGTSVAGRYDWNAIADRTWAAMTEAP